jgi:hypothetical protein
MPMRCFLLRRLSRVPSASESISHIDDPRSQVTQLLLFEPFRVFGHEVTRGFLCVAGDVR